MSEAMLRPRVSAKTTTPGANVRSGPWPDAAEDRILLARVARQDRQAFRALADRHVGAILALARRMLRDDAEAEDVAQETLLRLWRAGETLDLGSHGLRPWLRRVASNLCIDRVRGSKRTVVVDELPEVADPPRQMAGLIEDDLAKRVDQAMKALPERQRLALTLFHHEGLESRSRWGTSWEFQTRPSKSLLSRARRSLKAALESEWKSLLEGGAE